MTLSTAASTTGRCIRRASLLAVCLFASMAAEGIAQSEDPDDSKTSVLREQTVYVPYAKLRDSFEKNGRGVFLPYEQFQALWKAARAGETRAPEVGPPVDSVITEIQSEATIAEDVISVAANLKIELLTDGWHEIPLRLADAAIGEAVLDGKPARLITKNGYQLLVKKEKADPAEIQLSLKYSKAYTKAPGQNSVSLQAPQAPVNRWQIRIPEPGVKVNVQPMIAAAEVPAAESDEEPTETVVMAFLGAAPNIRIGWTPKAEGALGLAALATVQAEQQVSLDQGVVRTRAQLRYEITRADLSQLRIEVPSDHKVAGVFDANVRQWDVKTEGDVQQIAIQLFQPTRGRQPLTVDLEKFIGEFDKERFAVPVVKALDVGRQQGIVVVRLGEGLRADNVSRSGLLQLDAAELPRNLGPGQWNFAFRYAALPFELNMDVEKIQPRILADQLVEVYLEPNKLTLDLLALYDIQKVGVFQLRIDIPTGFEIRQVTGREAPGATPVLVDTYHVADDDKTKLQVNLARKAAGKVGLFVELERRLDDPNLLSPTGNDSEMVLPVPRVAPDSVERSSGRLIVCKPPSLRVNPSKLDGLRSISFAEAYQNIPTCRDARFPKSEPSLAFAFSDQPAELTVNVERRKPRITVQQILTVEIKSGQVKYVSKFHYKIDFSGVESLRIDVPEDLVSKINNTTSAIRESRFAPQPEDVADGYVAMELSGETELLGGVDVALEWEENMSDLEFGKPVSIVVPSLNPAKVQTATGQIIVAKSATIDIRAGEDHQGLRPIDPQYDVAPQDRLEGAARAFEFYGDWHLSLIATRYQLESLKTTSIEMGVVRQVVTRSGLISVQALYRMRSAQQRIELSLPSGQADQLEFDSEPVRINGTNRPLERGDGDQLFIPLVGQNSEEPFLLELRYTLRGTAGALHVPDFPGQPAVQKVYLCAYVPDEQALLGSQGPWTNQRPPWWYAMNYSNRHASRKVGGLIERVAQGTPSRGDLVNSFPVDGKVSIFSTLRPPTGSEGTLGLVTLNAKLFQSLVFAFVFVGGVVLVRRRTADKFTALAVLIIALILMGVFLPTLSGQVLQGVLLWALCVVLIVWLVWFVLVELPKIAAQRAEARAAAVATAVLSPASTIADPAESPPVVFEADTEAEAAEHESPDGGGEAPPDESEDSSEGGRHDD